MTGPISQALRPFDDQLADPDCGVAWRLDARCETLIVAFGGLGRRLGMPVFEFLGQLRGFDASLVMCRDRRRSWYHRGIRDVGDDIDDVAALLQALRERSAARRVVTVGTSAGGYAALLFGGLIDADVALAFGPQTFITPELRARYNEIRWAKHIRSLTSRDAMDPRYADLAVGLAEVGARTRYEIHYSDARDAEHVHHLAEAVDVVVHDHGSGVHNTAGLLRDRGELKPILAAAVTGSRPVVTERPLRRFLRRAAMGSTGAVLGAAALVPQAL